jgi:hypothetical protein
MWEAIKGLMGGDTEAPALPVPDFNPWKEAVADVRDMTIGSFKSMGNAMGQMIESWVLYGNVGPNAIRKMVAAVLAALAAEAAVKAIFQLAEGFAKLAGFMPGPAALHFKAAALYGAIAVGAAVAGRAVAGSTFSQGAAAGGGGGASGGGGAVSNGPRTIEQDRNRQPQVIILRIESNDSHIVSTVVKDIQNAGNIRTVMQSGGTLAAA